METLLNDIEDQKLQVAVAQSEKAQLQSDFQSELAERDFAFTNAQQTIASLEKEVEDLNEEIQQEEVRNEIARLARADSKLSGGQPTAETFGNAQHFNIAHDESHAAAIHKNTGRPIAVLSKGAVASASSDPRHAPTKQFHP